MSKTKAQSTQKLVNAFPEWADVRSDEQSLGFQFLNYVAGNHLDHLYKQTIRAGANQYLGTAVVSDPDVFHSVKLPKTYEFVRADDDETEINYLAPIVSGTVTTTTYPVILASGNNMTGFWLDAVPSRMELGTTYSGEHLLASGFIVRSPFEPLVVTGVTHMPNQLSVTLSGGTSYLTIQNGQVSQGLVQIDGETREGQFLTEELLFLQDDTKRTRHDFTSISGVRIYGVDAPETTFVWVRSADFRNDHRPVAYELDNTIEGDSIPHSWSLNYSETLGVQVLRRERYDFSQWDLRMAGYLSRSSVVEFEVLNEHSENIILLDVIVEPHSERLWGVTTDTLYCYDASLPYPDTSNILERNFDAMCRIEPSSYFITRGEEVELSYIWRRPVTGIVKHRVWVEKPDGTKKTLLDGAEATYTTGVDSWVWGEPFNRNLRPHEIYTLDQRGEYIYSFEVYYTDETTSIDQRVITVPVKIPLAQFSLSSLGVYRPVVGIDIDSENKIWVLNDQNGKHEIHPHWDLMLIDYKNKIVYFREDYDKVRVF